MIPTHPAVATAKPTEALRFGAQKDIRASHFSFAEPLKTSWAQIDLQHCKARDIQTSSGNISLDDTQVKGRVKSSSGSIRMTDTSAQGAESSSGNITAKGSASSKAAIGSVKSSSGQVSLDNISADAVETSSGNIQADNATLGRVRTSSGKLQLRNVTADTLSASSGNIALTDGQALSARTSSGNIRLVNSQLQQDLSTSFGVLTLDNTKVGGTITTCASDRRGEPILRLSNRSEARNIRVDQAETMGNDSFVSNVVIVNGQVIQGGNLSGGRKNDDPQVVEIAEGSVVKGNIEFESGKGLVRLKNGGRLEGRVIGGKVEGQEDPPQDSPPPAAEDGHSENPLHKKWYRFL